MNEPSEPAPVAQQLGDLLTSRMRGVEIALLTRVLATTLAGALPAARVRVRRRRSITDIMRHRPGVVVGVTVLGADRELVLHATDVDRIDANVAHVVRGVTLSRREVSVAEWLDELAVVLNHVATEDATTQAALRRALLT